MFQTILDLLVTALGATAGTTLYVTLEVLATLFSVFLVSLPLIIVTSIIVWIVKLMLR